MVSILYADQPLDVLYCSWGLSVTKFGVCTIADPSLVTAETFRAETITQRGEFFPGEKYVYHRKLDGEISPLSVDGGTGIVLNGVTYYSSGYTEVQQKGRVTRVLVYSDGPFTRLLAGEYDPSSKEKAMSRTIFHVFLNRNTRRWGQTRHDTTKSSFEAWWGYVLSVAPGRTSTSYAAARTSVVAPRVDPLVFHELCSKLLSTEVAYLPEDKERSLYRSCLEGQKDFNGNMINFVSKVKSFGTSVRSLVALASDPTDPKAWASAWLANRFSDRLLLRNMEQMGKGFYKDLKEYFSGNQTSRSSLSYSPSDYVSLFDKVSMESHAKLVCSNKSCSDLMSLIKKFYEWDAYPTLENAWDLVPFSFVVDWFLNLGSILDNIDMMVYNQYLCVKVYERSDKISYKIRSDWFCRQTGYPYGVDLLLTSYERRKSSVPDLGILDDWSPSLPSPTNVVDLTALAIQLFG